jgi:glutamate-1-semialdehyde 2,1-aminomutase/spore coat polysaccharide biosynthesis protein SpsF
MAVDDVSVKAVAFVQARMGSTRFPGKVLRSVEGEPLLARLCARLSQAQTLAQVVVATGDDPANDAIVKVCEARDIPCFVGSEELVLDRICAAAEHHGADVVVGVTGDCPLIDPRVADLVVREFAKHKPDLCTTSPSHTFPDGFGVEVFSREVLRLAQKEARDPLEREHLTLFIRRRPDRFKIRYVENDTYHPFTDLHLSVDDENDFVLVEKIFRHFLPERPLFRVSDVLAALRENPTWLDGHPDRPLNEGYFRGFFSEHGHGVAGPREAVLASSATLLERAKACIPSCTQTFSKGYTQFVRGVSPVYVERGEGGRIHDVDGNEYVDTVLGLGAVTLGYGHSGVNAAVSEQLGKGVSFSLPHRLEVELAERLCRVVPCAEMVRFGKNGSDATTGAVRVARAFTGREKILCCGYHGWHDWYIGTTLRDRGVPASTRELTLTFPYGDLVALEARLTENGGEVAGVVMEPVGTSLPPDGYLEGVRELARSHGALLIFDEIVTGFRVSEGGAQAYFGVTPDLACFGKGMANGFPISAVVGRRDVMQEFDRCFFSFTFGGEALSLAAALATMEAFEEDSVVSHLWIRGRKLKDAYNHLSRSHGLEDSTWCQGLPPRGVAMFEGTEVAEARVYHSLFLQECIRRGVLTNGVFATCRMHTEAEIEHVVAAMGGAFETLSAAYRSDSPMDYLLGPPTEPIFRRRDY